MKATKVLAKILSVALILTLLFVFVSCKGSLKLESFTVDRSTVKTEYSVGEAIDFSGIKATVRYSDSDLNTEYTASDLEIEYPEDITATPGTKTVIVSFMDPHLGVKQQTSVNITVVGAPAGGDDTTDDESVYTVVQFEKDAALTAFDSDNTSAGKTEYGQSGFSGEFVNGNKVYVIGDDNEFKLVPVFAIMDQNGAITTLESFYSEVEISVLVNDEYVVLDKSEIDANKYEYSLNGNTLVTVNTYFGSYSFNTEIDGVKISVLPSAEHYLGADDVNPVVLEARVIDAYNVYEAWQLAVIDNFTGRTDWDDFKLEHGISGVNPKGVVIHKDIHISADDVPATFFNVSTKDVEYINKPGEEVLGTQIAPAGTRYLKDQTVIYDRVWGDFFIEGNFFTIDTRNFPLVASPVVFDADLKLDYGADYSNAALLRFAANDGIQDWTRDTTTSSSVLFTNVAFIGNAARDNWLDANGNLVTAGGLSLVKSIRNAVITVDNVINNSFFISYFAELRGHYVIDDAKCYDSYQNALFIWGDSTLVMTNSFVVGTGGPVGINMSILHEGAYFSPSVQITDTVLDTSLTGGEVWFKAVGATQLVGNIQALGFGVNQMVTTATGGQMNANWVDSDGTMNLLSVLMPGGSSIEALNDGMIEGSVSIDGLGIDRWYNPATAENVSMDWISILQHPAFAQGAPFITVFDMEGNAHTLYFVQQGESGMFYDLSNNPLGTDPSHQAIIMAFATSEVAILHQGGLSVVFQLYH